MYCGVITDRVKDDQCYRTADHVIIIFSCVCVGRIYSILLVALRRMSMSGYSTSRQHMGMGQVSELGAEGAGESTTLKFTVSNAPNKCLVCESLHTGMMREYGVVHLCYYGIRTG